MQFNLLIHNCQAGGLELTHASHPWEGKPYDLLPWERQQYAADSPIRDEFYRLLDVCEVIPPAWSSRPIQVYTHERRAFRVQHKAPPDPRGRSAWGESPNRHLHRLQNAQAARAKIRRLLKKYFIHRIRLWTLTFRDLIGDVEEADRHWRRFTRRLRRYLARRGRAVNYLAVRELQRRGAWHYHVALSEFVPFRVLTWLWGQGYVYVVHGVGQGAGQVASYLHKYLLKSVGEPCTCTGPGSCAPCQLYRKHLYLRNHGMFVERLKSLVSAPGLARLLGGLVGIGGRIVREWTWAPDADRYPGYVLTGYQIAWS